MSEALYLPTPTVTASNCTGTERKHPKRWGRRMDVTSGDEPIQGVVPVKVETAEEARRALRAMGVRTN